MKEYDIDKGKVVEFVKCRLNNSNLSFDILKSINQMKNIKKILSGVSVAVFVFGIFASNVSPVAAITPLVISPSSPNVPPYTSIPSGIVTAPYDFTFGISGGIGVDTWHIYIDGIAGGPPGLTLSSTGELDGTPSAPGTYTIEIQATDQSEDIATAFYTITINAAVNVSGVSITSPTSTMAVGQTYQLAAIVAPSNATNQGVTWSSNNTSTVMVDGSGLVTAATAGSATITVTTADGGFTASDPITVSVLGNSTIVLPVLGGSCAPRDTSFPYDVVDLGPGVANAISQNGRIAGQNGNGVAFLYASGTIEYFAVGDAYGVNNSGQVVGVTGSGDAFLYSSSTMQDLGSGAAFGINDNGQVVGSSNGTAFLYSGGQMLDLDGIKASGINDNSQVVGLNSIYQNVFLYPTSTDQKLIADDDGFVTAGPLINNNGNAVGTIEYSGEGWINAYLYSSSTLTDLGGLSVDIYGRSMSTGLGINDSDEVVGWSDTMNGSGGGQHAFLYTAGPVLDLNDLIDPTSGWTLEQANGINDAGEIVGFGTNSSGRTDAFLLIPNNLCPPNSVITITTTSLASGTAGVAYNQFVSATSTTPGDMLSWNIAGLPSGLAYNSSTGEITGTPLATSTNTLAITVTDANPSSTPASVDIGLTINAPTATPAVIVSSTAPIASIDVANGTVLGSVGLPAITTATLSNGSTASLAVTWDGGTPPYDAAASGTYVFTGTLTLPDGIANPSGVTASVNVIVAAPTTGTLVVEKDAIGGDGTFTFTGNNGIGNFSITTASGTGIDTFDNMTPGTYTITETNIPKGWTQTDSSCASVTVTAGGVDTCIITNTMNAKLGEIRGTKYVDKDGDGTLQDGDHHRLAGVTIYLDLNKDGKLDSGDPSMVTNKLGEYHFSNLPAGTYIVREVEQPGWIETYPASGSYTINLAAGKISKNDDFGDFKLGTISGVDFNDLNGNGRKNKNELDLSGWKITLTKLHSSFTETTTTDANGNYSFTNLNPGTYQVRETEQAGWVQTTRNPSDITIDSGTISKNDNFGSRLKTTTK